MAVQWITPVDVTPSGADATWLDVDVTAHVSASATGVLVHVHNTNGGDRWIILRNNGSTDHRERDKESTSHTWAVVGIDADDIFEAAMEDVASAVLWLVGYFEADGAFFTNGVDKTGTRDQWSDADITADVTSGTAIAACIEFSGESRSRAVDFGARKNGSTDDRHPNFEAGGWAIVGVDGSEIFEAWVGINSDSTAQVFLLGYILDDSTWDTNGVDLSLGSTGSWIDLSSLPAGATGASIDVVGTTTNDQYGLRKDGTLENIVAKCAGGLHAWGFVESASQVIEGQVDSTNVDFFRVGYFEAGGAPAATSLPHARGCMANQLVARF